MPVIAGVALGGALGASARYLLDRFIEQHTESVFPWATFAINVTGSLAIGLLATVLPRWWPGGSARLFLIVGFLGGYTTFSSFALDGHTLWERGEIVRSLAYLGGSVAAGFVAVVLGIMLGRAVVGPTAEAPPIEQSS